MPRRLIRVEGGGEERTVRLRLEFNPNGTLATPPVVLNPKSSKDFLMLAESTIRATNGLPTVQIAREEVCDLEDRHNEF
jgi:hypothetical protein